MFFKNFVIAIFKTIFFSVGIYYGIIAFVCLFFNISSRIAGVNMSTNIESPSVFTVKMNEGTDKNYVFIFKEGYLTTLKYNDKEYSGKKEINKYFESNKKEHYSEIQSSLQNIASSIRLAISVFVACISIFFIAFSPEKNSNGDMPLSNFLCTFLSAIVAAISFINPSYKNNFYLSIVVIFYTSTQVAIKFKTSIFNHDTGIFNHDTGIFSHDI